jgi:hypothetical protein
MQGADVLARNEDVLTAKPLGNDKLKVAALGAPVSPI